MPKAPAKHRPQQARVARYLPPEASRQARRALATTSAAWRLIRSEQLAREPYCRVCRSKGVWRLANQVDHIDGDSTNDAPSNHQSLCRPCHSRKTARENGGFGNRRVPHVPWNGTRGSG